MVRIGSCRLPDVGSIPSCSAYPCSSNGRAHDYGSWFVGGSSPSRGAIIEDNTWVLLYFIGMSARGQLSMTEVLRIYSETSSTYTNYTQPNWEDEFGEMEREVSENLLPQGTPEEQKQVALRMLSDFKNVPPQPLPDNIWSQLQNTDSYSIPVGGFDQAKALADEYERDIGAIISMIQSNAPLPPPQILRRPDGQYTLIGGNTRLMAFRALGIQPKVLVVDWAK